MGCALDESPKHVEFSPMDFVSLSSAEIWVSLMSTNEIRHMYLPVRHLSSVAYIRWWGHVQSRNACSFGVFQRHPIGLVSTPVLKQDIPRQKIFVVIWRFGFEYFHRIVALKSRIVYSSYEGAESRIIIQGTELVGDIDKSLDLPRSIFGFIVT